MKAHSSDLCVTHVLAALLAITTLSCSRTTDIQEVGQLVGDTMASLDEASGTSTGNFRETSRLGLEKTMSRLEREPLLSDSDLADATCASSPGFGSCSGDVITRNFGSCTVGLATFTGTVTLTWVDGNAGTTCQMDSQNDTITRNPSFTVTGRRGATLTVSKTGTNGQVITRGVSATTYTFSNDGIRRVFTTSGGSTLFDLTTQTTSDITISGQNRASRTLSGGTLRLTNNLSNVTCDVSPNSVTWNSSCNCAVSGSWSGSCSDGKSFSLTISGCGSASMTIGDETEDFTFDRCYS